MPNNMGLDEQARDEELRRRINKRVKEMEAEDSAGKLSRKGFEKALGNTQSKGFSS